MRVVSGLADVEFRVGSVTREGTALVLKNRPEAGLPTVVYMQPRDAIEMLVALISTRGGLSFILLLPWLWWQARRLPEPTQSDQSNNPWK